MFAIGVWVGLLGALGSLACSSDEGGACLAYACNNWGTLSGTVELSTAKLVDVRFCENTDCRNGLIDLEALENDQACATWQYNLQACFAPSGASGKFTVKATWEHLGNEALPEGPHTLELTVTDHETGARLVSETRAIQYEVTREDSCHRCFGAEAEL